MECMCPFGTSSWRRADAISGSLLYSTNETLQLRKGSQARMAARIGLPGQTATNGRVKTGRACVVHACGWGRAILTFHRRGGAGGSGPCHVTPLNADGACSEPPFPIEGPTTLRRSSRNEAAAQSRRLPGSHFAPSPSSPTLIVRDRVRKLRAGVHVVPDAGTAWGRFVSAQSCHPYRSSTPQRTTRPLPPGPRSCPGTRHRCATWLAGR